ncbi:peroxiredoxin family protein [Pedobacter kyonggii]|uniref:thioredoxin-dependent peroxiredoxin n=1 Tax=Pedobacter kyonggii TaxID=1926871 RepID=A0A4Q9HF86_9SPHI|nr:peroxiredoxin family protein [Pedobacter kyonggii]TBO43601.1 peroxiredoxin family protein [Pedobacter kyonggii]
MKRNRNTKAALKSSLFALTLVSFSALSINAAATAQTTSVTPARHISVSRDTVKMTSGVPLKAEDVSPLLAGEQIPVLQLRKSSGEKFDLNKSVSETPTILVFYRGGWCPYCSKQLSGLQEIEKDLTKMGYQIVAISTDSPENLNKTMDKEKLSYTLLSDADLNAAKRFGIAFKSPKSYDKFLPETSGGKNTDKLLPVPSVFILNKKGNILFEYINPNMTQRLSAPLLKAAAAALRQEI